MVIERSRTINTLLNKQMLACLPDEPVRKEFKSKHNFPVLNDYSVNADDSYWSEWPKLSWDKGKDIKSSIDHEVLKSLADQTGFPFPCLLKEICKDIETGASLGISQEYLMPSTATNAPSAHAEGEKVSDELAKWIEKGFAIGPFREEDIPFDKVKYSGLMTKEKGSSVRIILNFSRGTPAAINDGINSKDFPTAMASTEKWIRVLLRCGRGARFCKNDWASAYKHVRVRHDEVWIQGFRWLGRVFFELCLVFGGKSSAGLYDRLAKVVLWIALVRSLFPKHLCVQHLDDVCGASPAGTDHVDRFYNTYRHVCEMVGVTLADPTDKDKSFPPTTNGQVLGINYDTAEGLTGTWYLSEDKMAGIILMLEKAIEGEESSQQFIKSLCGKLIHIRFLVRNSKYRMGQIIIAANQTTNMSARVAVSDWCRSDMFWWKNALPVFSYRSELIDPDRKPGPLAVMSHTDAAGGSAKSFGRGVGMTIYPDIWTVVLWGKRINLGFKGLDGKGLDSLMSAWELLGPLLTVCVAPDRVRNKQVVVKVDNEGSVRMYSKGWTTKCQLCNTILVAINEVATALNVDLFVEKIKRCSNDQAKAADALSKMDLGLFRRIMPALNPGPNP